FAPTGNGAGGCAAAAGAAGAGAGCAGLAGGGCCPAGGVWANATPALMNTASGAARTRPLIPNPFNGCESSIVLESGPDGEPELERLLRLQRVVEDAAA